MYVQAKLVMSLAGAALFLICPYTSSQLIWFRVQAPLFAIRQVAKSSSAKKIWVRSFHKFNWPLEIVEIIRNFVKFQNLIYLLFTLLREEICLFDMKGNVNEKVLAVSAERIIKTHPEYIALKLEWSNNWLIHSLYTNFSFPLRT